MNKNKKVSNGNYLWISYFYSYLGLKGRSGFVMSSQASSAGNTEAEVRRKIVQTGDVDVMISIRGNFFYTRTVPCELWHFDKGKPADRRDQVLMLDARNVFRKITRNICDFSPEQQQNLSAIVWLYRGQTDHFLNLVGQYVEGVVRESGEITRVLSAFDIALGPVDEFLANAEDDINAAKKLDTAIGDAFSEAMDESSNAVDAYTAGRHEIEAAAAKLAKSYGKAIPKTNAQQHAAGKVIETFAHQVGELARQIDHACKLLGRAVEAAGKAVAANDSLADQIDRRRGGRLLKELEVQRKAAVDHLKQVVHLQKQIVWLQTRFPEAEFAAVPGLCRIVTRKEIETADWSLTPGRYVGVAPVEVDEDFDFGQAMRDIHVKLANLNKEAAELAATIQANFEELAI